MEGETYCALKGHIQPETPCLSYGAAEKNCIRAQGTLFQTSAGLARPIYSSTASISPGCFGASWVVETITDQVDRYRQFDTRIQ